MSLCYRTGSCVAAVSIPHAERSRSSRAPLPAQVWPAEWGDCRNCDRVCFSWEKDTDDWWLHRPDWFVVSENATHGCFGHQESPSSALLRRIHAVQFSADIELNSCDVSATVPLDDRGWFAATDVIARMLPGTVLGGIPLLPEFEPAGWRFALGGDDSTPACPARDISCYGLSLSNCHTAKTTRPASELRNDSNVLHLKQTTRSNSGRVFSAESVQLPWLLFEHYAFRPRHWLRRAVFEYGTQPKRSAAEPPCALMHVRRGDVAADFVKGRGWLHNISEYVEALQVDGGYTTSPPIWLFSNDAAILTEARAQFPTFEWRSKMEHLVPRWRMHGASRDVACYGCHVTSIDPKHEVVMLLGLVRLAATTGCTAFVHSESGVADAMLRAASLGGTREVVDLSLLPHCAGSNMHDLGRLRRCYDDTRGTVMGQRDGPLGGANHPPTRTLRSRRRRDVRAADSAGNPAPARDAARSARGSTLGEAGRECSGASEGASQSPAAEAYQLRGRQKDFDRVSMAKSPAAELRALRSELCAALVK